MKIGEVCLLTNDVLKLAAFYKQLLGAKIIEPPTKRPWGAINMSFYDPDNNMIFFRFYLRFIARIFN